VSVSRDVENLENRVKKCQIIRGVSSLVCEIYQLSKEPVVVLTGQLNRDVYSCCQGSLVLATQ